ncbi:hypothetical protein LCGC14_2945660, partial [marine sediment metagenome]
LKGEEPHMVTVVATRDVDYVMDLKGGRDWVHDVRDSPLEWISAYDGEAWRIATM